MNFFYYNIFNYLTCFQYFFYYLVFIYHVWFFLHLVSNSQLACSKHERSHTGIVTTCKYGCGYQSDRKNCFILGSSTYHNCLQSQEARKSQTSSSSSSSKVRSKVKSTVKSYNSKFQVKMEKKKKRKMTNDKLSVNVGLVLECWWKGEGWHKCTVQTVKVPKGNKNDIEIIFLHH